MKDQHAFVLLIGDSEGLGNAVLLGLLNQAEPINVIGVSRRAAALVENVDRLTANQKSHFYHLSADFMQSTSTLIEQVGDLIASNQGYLKSVILVTGSGFLDSEIETNPELEEVLLRLNYGVQVELVEALLQTQLMTAETHLVYFSAMITHDSINDPLLLIHEKVKKKTTRWLHQTLGNQLSVVLPGAYQTDMLMRIIVRKDSLLEWFSFPLADVNDVRGIGRKVALLALSNKKLKYRSYICPRGIKGLVSVASAKTIRKLLPFAIRQTSRTVLHQIGQTDEDHDRRIEHAKTLQLYGNTFPYDSIKSNRLWSLRSSLFLTGVMRFFGLLR